MSRQWTYKRIGEVCIVERGGSPRPIDDYITEEADGVNWIKIGDTTDSMFITQTAQKIRPDGMKKSRYVLPGDFLLSNSMSFGRPYILKIDGCIHDGWLVLRDKDKLFDKRFLYYYLSAKPTYEKFKQMAVGGVVNNLNSEMVRKVEVPIPNQEEQAQIADLLDKINDIIILRKQQLQDLDVLIKARFVEMLMEEKSIPVKLKDIVEQDRIITYGMVKPGKDVPGGVIIIKVKDFPRGFIDTSDFLHADPVLEEKYARSRVKEGDLLYSIRGTVGRTAFVTKKLVGANITQDTARLSIDRKLYNANYVRYALEYDDVVRQIESQIKGVAMKGISLSELREIEIPCVNYDWQQEFGIFVDQVDKSKVAVQQALDKAQLLFDSLMQQYFA